jgi:hypothetical protein
MAYTPKAVLSAKNFIPQIYSAKLQEKFYSTAVVPAISNTDWEGEISSYGDKVIIRTVPTVTIKDWTTSGATVEYDQLGTAGAIDFTDHITLTIDQAKYYAFSVDYIDEFMSDLNVIDMTTQDAAMQMSINIDKQVLAALAAASKTSPTFTSGEIKQLASFNYNSGAATVVDKLLEAGQALDEQNVPRDGKRFVVLNPGMARTLKNSDLKSALITGDSVSPMRNGQIGEIDGMTIYVSNNLPNSATNAVGDGDTNKFESGEQCPVIVGHNCGLTFASQFIKHEMLPLTDRFGYGVKGLQVFGFKIVKPESLVILPVYSA